MPVCSDVFPPVAVCFSPLAFHGATAQPAFLRGLLLTHNDVVSGTFPVAAVCSKLLSSSVPLCFPWCVTWNAPSRHRKAACALCALYDGQDVAWRLLVCYHWLVVGNPSNHFSLHLNLFFLRRQANFMACSLSIMDVLMCQEDMSCSCFSGSESLF